jgi:H2-forming N5,N10-methylenetetrahydromethanopterin dehydrogenase-like enzyme
MDSGISTVRNLLYVVLVLVILALASNFYVVSQLEQNSEELANLQLLIRKQLMGSALTQAEELQKRMEALNESASGIDAKMKQAQDEMDAKLKKAQDDFVARMNVELPKMMDNYIKQRANGLQGVIPQEVREKIPKPTN